MKLLVSRADVWAATIQDRPGAIAAKLAPLAQARANLEFVIARRSPDRPGKGVLFVTPLKGARQIRAAKGAAFKKTKSLHSLRVEGPDKAGVGAKMTQALGKAGINLGGLSAAALRKQFVAYLAFDTAADAARAARILAR